MIDVEKTGWLQILYYPKGADKGQYIGRFYGKYSDGDAHVIFTYQRHRKVPAKDLFYAEDPSRYREKETIND